MKRFFGKLGIFAFAATLFVGCSEDLFPMRVLTM